MSEHPLEFLLDCAAYWSREADRFDADYHRLTRSGELAGAAFAQGARDAYRGMARTFRRHLKAERGAAA